MINNTSEPSQSTPLSLCGNIEDSSLRTTGSQTEADTYCPAPSPYTADPISPNRSTTSGARQKRGRSDNNILEAVVQGLSRSDLVDCLETYWQALTKGGIYTILLRQVLTWTLEGNSEQAFRLYYYLIFETIHINNDDRSRKKKT